MSFVRLLILIVNCSPSILAVANSAMNETFMYFAYGSNLLSKRIHFRNPTAKRRSIGKLENYRLDFNVQSCNWNGATVTVVEHVDYHVWGVIWEIDMSNMAELDRQEGVDRNLYRPITRSIATPTGELIECRLYQHVNEPGKVYELDDLPTDRQPSRTYLNCILKGAVESQLPIAYIDDILNEVRHNNQKANNRAFRQLCDCNDKK